MFLNKEYKERLIGLAVDEAHCIKTWLVKFYCQFHNKTVFVLGVKTSELHSHI